MPATFRVSIRADMEGVARVHTAFGAFADAHAVPDPVRRGMSVALDELLTNTISYGLAEDGSDVDVEGELGPDRLTVIVSDSGRPFDPFGRAAPDTTLPVEARPVGGLGIHIVKQLVDDAGYERRQNRNVVRLAMRLGEATGD